MLVNISGGQPTSQTSNVEVPIGGHEVNDADVRRALAQARQYQGNADQELIHSIAVGYAIDGNRGIRDRAACSATSWASSFTPSPPAQARCAIWRPASPAATWI